MDMYLLTMGFADIIAQSSDIKAWTQAHYAKDHKVYVAVDGRKWPGKDDCPCIIVAPIRKSVGQHQSEKFHEFIVIPRLWDESVNPHHGIANLVEYSGVQNVEELRKLAETAVVAYDIGNATIDTDITDYDMIEAFPFFMCGMTLSVWESVTIGSDPLL